MLQLLQSVLVLFERRRVRREPQLDAHGDQAEGVVLVGSAERLARQIVRRQQRQLVLLQHHQPRKRQQPRRRRRALPQLEAAVGREAPLAQQHLLEPVHRVVLGQRHREAQHARTARPVLAGVAPGERVLRLRPCGRSAVAVARSALPRHQRRVAEAGGVERELRAGGQHVPCAQLQPSVDGTQRQLGRGVVLQAQLRQRQQQRIARLRRHDAVGADDRGGRVERLRRERALVEEGGVVRPQQLQQRVVRRRLRVGMLLHVGLR